MPKNVFRSGTIGAGNTPGKFLIGQLTLHICLHANRPLLELCHCLNQASQSVLSET